MAGETTAHPALAPGAANWLQAMRCASGRDDSELAVDVDALTSGRKMAEDSDKKQLLHLVFGGELKTSDAAPNSAIWTSSTSSASIPTTTSAEAAWKAKAQASVDNAHMRYFVVHLHRLLEPGAA